MKLDINIRIFFSALFLLLLASAFSATYSYAAKPTTQATRANTSAFACTGNGTGTISTPGTDECELQPDEQKLSWKRIDLCTADPAEPTTTAATGLANCSTFFRNDAGAEVSVKKGTGTQIGKAADYFPVPHGSYTHGIITMGTTFKYKSSILFTGNMTDPAGVESATCVTKPSAGGTVFGFQDNLNFANSNVDCSANAVAAETTIGINTLSMTSDGQNCFHLKNFIGADGIVAGYLVEADGTLVDGVSDEDLIAKGQTGCQSGSSNGISSIVGIMNFTKPITIGPSTAGIQIKYNNTQGLKLDLNGSDTFYKFDVAFFDFTLTPKKSRARGAWR